MTDIESCLATLPQSSFKKKSTEIGTASRNDLGAHENPKRDFHHYLPVPDDLLNSGIYVTGAGRGVNLPGEFYPSAKHPLPYCLNWENGRILPGFSVMLIGSGRGIFETAKAGRLTLEAGAAVVLFPGIWHRYRPDPKTGWSEKWVHFNGQLPHQLRDQGILSPSRPVLRPGDFKSIEASMDRLHDVVRRDPASNSLYLSLMILNVIAGMAEKQDAPPSEVYRSRAKADPVVAAALDYIWTRSSKPLSVSETAYSIGLTRRTLERHMKECLGHSVLDEIIRCRFHRAEWFLRETNLPIKNIVHLAGFGSVQNMRSIFLARTGHAPGDYRTHFHVGASNHAIKAN